MTSASQAPASSPGYRAVGPGPGPGPGRGTPAPASRASHWTQFPNLGAPCHPAPSQQSSPSSPLQSPVFRRSMLSLAVIASQPFVLSKSGKAPRTAVGTADHTTPGNSDMPPWMTVWPPAGARKTDVVLIDDSDGSASPAQSSCGVRASVGGGPMDTKTQLLGDFAAACPQRA